MSVERLRSVGFAQSARVHARDVFNDFNSVSRVERLRSVGFRWIWKAKASSIAGITIFVLCVFVFLVVIFLTPACADDGGV